MFLFWLTMAQAPVVMSYHPPAAEGWHQSQRFRCGKTELRIEGIALSKPLQGAAIFVNDRPLRGESVTALRRDLSNSRAVYRLGAVCLQTSGSFQLYIDTGEKPHTGDVIFKKGVAYINNDELKMYRTELSNSESFWFR